MGPFISIAHGAIQYITRGSCQSAPPLLQTHTPHYHHFRTPQPRFRSLWERYCRGVQAIVFVVDSADMDSLGPAQDELHALLEKPSLRGTPLLVLGNKNDLSGALTSQQLITQLNLKV